MHPASSTFLGLLSEQAAVISIMRRSLQKNGREGAVGSEGDKPVNNALSETKRGLR